jgi:hypothetical protein
MGGAAGENLGVPWVLPLVQFVRSGDEDAFAALVARHGPMVGEALSDAEIVKSVERAESGTSLPRCGPSLCPRPGTPHGTWT